jgi:glycolate oxidase iron-sulfur subunit
MQTNISQAYRDTPQGREADAILRSCVHCGFCTATCPTYQLLGDELDSPRGRIYLIKQLLEGEPVTGKTQTHLDRCLTCRACETTCPSGVQYGHLVDIGRELVEQQVGRGPFSRLQRFALRKLLPYPARFKVLLGLATLFRPLLPAALKSKLPASRKATPDWPSQQQARRMLVLEGCVQSAATPDTNVYTARVLERLGIELLRPEGAGCCGAVSQHLSAPAEALDFVRRNIDAWWPHIQQGAEAIVITASGCGTMVKDYGHLLRDDPDYADRARQISERCKDIGEVLATEALPIGKAGNRPRIAFHSPCTLQHGQQLNGVVESVLVRLGFELLPVSDSHLCCGSAGTYSILQPRLSGQLLNNKLDALQQHQPELIATANIGCQLHLASGSRVPVKHWIELVHEALAESS